MSYGETPLFVAARAGRQGRVEGWEFRVEGLWGLRV